MSVGRIAVRFLLAASVVAALTLPSALAQTSAVEYLDASGIPGAGFSASAPTGALVNLDSGRDDDPGLVLGKTDEGSNETDPTKHQYWMSGDASGIILDGSASLIITAAMKDMDDESDGHISAYLMDCASNMSSCSVIDSGSVSASPWSAAGDWETRTIFFGTVTYEIASARRLVVKVIVDDATAQDDMWLAYDAATYPSRLVYTVASPPTTTTTTTGATTTTTGATTTTTGATTTTTGATSTTTEASTSTTEASTSTTEASTSTSTEGPASTAGTTTTVTTVPADGTSGIEETAVVVTLPTSGGPQTTLGMDTTPVEPPPEPSDVALASVGGSVASPEESGGGAMGVLHAVELLLPQAAAVLVVSPLIVIEAIVDALFSAGLTVSVPASLAGLVVGFLFIIVDRRREWGEIHG